MFSRIKTRISQSRNSGSLFNRFLNLIRHALFWMERRVEWIWANVYFFFNKGSKQQLIPDFLVVGMQKSATSWVDQMLRQHPELTLPEGKKEVHFFNQFQNLGLNWYLFHFRKGENKIKGEVTPGYSILPLETIREIKHLNPGLKVIFLLRNPVQRTWSQIYMSVVRLQGKQAEKLRVADYIKKLNSPPVVQRSDYLHILNNWNAVFPEEQLFIGYYDAVATDPTALLNQIFSFIGVKTLSDFQQFPLAEKVNQNHAVSPPVELEKMILERYEKEVEDLFRKLGHPTIQRWLEENQMRKKALFSNEN